MIVKGVAWFSGRDTIGVVICDDDGEEKAFIGTGVGEHELGDTITIAEWGSHFPLAEAKSIIEKFGSPQHIEI